MLVVVFLFLSQTVSSQIPVQDQCQYINQTEPPQCPQTIGPPCPPCIINNQPDYQNGDSLTFSSTTIDSINHYMNANIEYWINTWPPDKIYPANQPFDVAQGSAGRGLLFFRLYHYTQNISYLNLAQQYIDTALSELDKFNPSYTSFFQGYNGVYTVAAQIAFAKNNNAAFTEYISNIIDIINDVNTAIISGDSRSPKYHFDMKDCGLWTGLSGLLYNSMLLNDIFDNSSLIDASYISNVAYHIIQTGLQFAKQQNVDYLTYYAGFDNLCYLVGSGDGTGGVIRTIFSAYLHGYIPKLFDNYTIYSAIKNTMDWFVSIQFNDGNMPTYPSGNIACAQDFGNDSNARVQWCHGAPGFIDTFSKATLIYDMLNKTSDADSYFNAGLKAYNSTWNRGLIIKGLMQCHGIGGNIYTLLNMFENLQTLQKQSTYFNNKYNLTYLINQSGWRAKQFIKWTLNDVHLNALRTEYSNQDFSMWWSSYGIPVLYIQNIQNQWPYNVPVCMIGWNFCRF